MTSVHGFCSECGAIDVPLGALSVELPDENHPGSYTYPCPSCAGLVRETAGHHLAEVLVSFGAPLSGTDAGTVQVRSSHDDGLTRVHFFAA